MSSMNTNMERESYSLFNDQKMKSAFASLSPEQQDTYKRQGEHMYSKDYENIGSEEDKMIEAAAFISEGLKSGLRPSQLEANETEIMRSVFGSNWFKRYNYESEQD